MGCVIHQTSHAASPTNQPTKPHPPPKNSIHGKLPTLSSELMERLRQALLLFMSRANLKGPVPFLAKPVPTR